MSDSAQTRYVFALCNPGSERALKLEVEAMGLGWRPSYQRRGFVSFKADENISDTALEIACARRLCISLGKTDSREEAVERVRLLGCAKIHDAIYQDRQMRGIAGENGGEPPAIGALIGTIVQLGPAEFWAGYHRHAEFQSPAPAGDSGLEMPENSPSRAWLKIEEAGRFFGMDFSSDDIVVELGCAPGGVVLSLINRGIPVIGVDPAKMADVVMDHAISERDAVPNNIPWFYHCRKPAALVSKRDLGKDVTWFMSDMNQSPEVVLKECARFCKMAPTIRGVLVTLKLTDLSEVAKKAQWHAALHGMGFKMTRLQQFSVHHKELALLGLR